MITSFELAAEQMRGQRYSWPPYFVAQTIPARWPVAVLPGKTYELLERGFAPTARDAKLMLIRLRQKLRWSRACMAAFLGVSRNVLRRWETGERQPSGAARRLIWLIDLLVREPASLKSGLDLILWGKGKECLKFNKQFH